MIPRLNRALAISGAALAVFHGWLFVSQAVAGRLWDPWVIFRWLAAAALIAGLAALHRRGNRLVSRKGIALWLLAALLHGPAIADNENFQTFAIPEAAATSVLQVLSSAGLAISLWMLATLLAARRTASRWRRSHLSIVVVSNRFAGGHSLRLSPRPPPPPLTVDC
jgi:hypothetical protein